MQRTIRLSITRSTRGRVATGALAVVVGILAFAPAAGATTPTPGGTASARNTLLSLTVGGTSVQVAFDEASSAWSATPRAFAHMLLGKAGALTLEGATKTSTAHAQNGTAPIASRTAALDGVADLKVADGSVAAYVMPDHVASSVGLTAGTIDLLNGFGSVSSASEFTLTRVEAAKALSTRTLSLGDVSALKLGDVLNHLGIDPLALACSALQSTGTLLGVDASSACAQLTAAQGAISSAQSALATQKAAVEALVAGFSLSQVQADAATISALSCGLLDLVCQAAALATITTIVTTVGYVVNLTGLNFFDAKTAVLNVLDGLVLDFGNLSVLTTGVTTAASGVCSTVSGALGTVVSSIPSLGSVLNPLGTLVTSACDTLAGTVNLLLDTPLISFGGLNVDLQAVATPNAPVATVGGTLGTLKIGNLAPLGLSLSTLTDLTSKVATALAQLTDALKALGLGLGTPELQLMKSSTQKGQHADGTWFADASLTGLHVRIPPATVTLPGSNPLGLLQGTAGLLAARRFVRTAASTMTTPDVQLDAAKFSAAATFLPGAGGTLGELPTTGLNDGPARMLLAMVLVAAAAAVRRSLFAR